LVQVVVMYALAELGLAATQATPVVGPVVVAAGQLVVV
jgi:hypothetical protein